MRGLASFERRRPPEISAEARRRATLVLAQLGGDIRSARLRRRQTQADLASLAGTTQSTISELERGRGGSLRLEGWLRVAVALGVPLRFGFDRDEMSLPSDAGHLAIQELVLRQARTNGFARSFELPSRPTDPSRSSDVTIRMERHGVVVLVECWNDLRDIGAAARSSTRKLADAAALAAGLADGRLGLRVAGCWVLRATRRNRELVRRYPEIFAARFPGSSTRWLRALVDGAPPPSEQGFMWCDVGGSRLFAARLNSADRRRR